MRLDLKTKNVVRAAAGQLATGTFSSTPYLDLTLPVGSILFELLLADITLSHLDGISVALSQNGGVSYINDSTNFDSYSTSMFNFTSLSSSATVTNAADSLISPSFQQDPTSPIPYSIRLRIHVGSASKLAITTFESFADPGSVAVTQAVGHSFVNPAATIPPQMKRVNAIRILPYGAGDVPPTSGHTITGGTYILREII